MDPIFKKLHASLDLFLIKFEFPWKKCLSATIQQIKLDGVDIDLS